MAAEAKISEMTTMPQQRSERPAPHAPKPAPALMPKLCETGDDTTKYFSRRGNAILERNAARQPPSRSSQWGVCGVGLDLDFLPNMLPILEVDHRKLETRLS